MLVVGGTQSLAGAVVGTLFIALVSALLIRIEAGLTIAGVEVPGRPGLQEVVLALIMLATLIARPAGITGGREVPPLARLAKRRRSRGALRPRPAGIEMRGGPQAPGR